MTRLATMGAAEAKRYLMEVTQGDGKRERKRLLEVTQGDNASDPG